MSVPTTTMRIDPELKDRANKVLREQGLPIDMSIRSDKTDESNR